VTLELLFVFLRRGAIGSRPAVGLLTLGLLFGQGVIPSFEIASVKHCSEQDRFQSLRADAGRISFSAYNMRLIIMMAYGIQPAQIKGPDWIDGETYSITAKLPDGATKEQIPDMLKSLLVDRFHLQGHWDEQEELGYELLRSKGPSRFANSRPEDTPRTSFSGQRIELKKSNFAALSRLLSSVYIGKPVVDKTGIDGNINILLQAPEDDSEPFIMAGQRPAIADGAAPDPEPSRSLFAAIRRAGLELKPAKVATRVFVVDSIDKNPTPN